MSRSNYSDDLGSEWAMICWRGAVKSAIRGKRGQAFLQEMLEALDDLPEKRLIPHELVEGGEVCALGAVGKKRGIPMDGIDPECSEYIAGLFGIADAMGREIMFINDDDWYGREVTPEARFIRVRAWVVANMERRNEKSESG